ncbi:F174B protein, partial [Polyodon spathula]|nr:membrane protein FAM174B-like [Polyodon spathula]MBN3277864.1 F174B protein [Polyodon spathula]
MYPFYFTCILVIVGTWGVLGSLPTSAGNSSAASILENSSDQTNSTYTFPFGDNISTILRDLPTLKNIVFIVCGFTAFLIACLVVKVFRSGRKIRKTRKYDLITTPAERVEMAPLNGDNNDEDEDSTLFDVKYR